MTHLIDSDWVADFLAGRQPALELVATLLPLGLAMSVISYMEVAEGVRGSRMREAMDQGFREFLQGVEILDVTHAIADQGANIRIELRRQKRQVNERAMDILIAATALEHGLVLVTRNVRDYEDIPRLQLYALT